MTEETAYRCLVAIYGIYGKVAPAAGSATVKMLAQRVTDIPDRLASYVVDKVGDQNTLPQNLSKAFRGAWHTWQMENPNQMHTEACRVCGGFGGWNYYHNDEDGILREYFSFCPVCSWKEGRKCKTQAELEELGLLVLPNDYPGGRLKFFADLELVLFGGEQ